MADPGRISRMRILSMCCSVATFVFVMGLIVGLVFVFRTFTNANNQSNEIDSLMEQVDVLEKKTEDLQEQLNNITQFIEDNEECIDGVCSSLDAPLFPCWDAFLNFPLLSNGTQGNNSQVYIVCQPGNTTINGESNWVVGNLIVFARNISRWVKVGPDVMGGAAEFVVERIFNSTNLTLPFGVTEINIYCQGGGGGGASGGGGGVDHGGGGGGGGSGDFQPVTMTVPTGDTISIIIGAGGAGAGSTGALSNGMNGDDGRATFVTTSTLVDLCTAYGGSGGSFGWVFTNGTAIGGNGGAGRMGGGGGVGNTEFDDGPGGPGDGGIGGIKDGQPGEDNRLIANQTSVRGGDGAPYNGRHTQEFAISGGIGGRGDPGDFFGPSSGGGGGACLDISAIGFFGTGGNGGDTTGTDGEPGTNATQPGCGGGAGAGGMLGSGGGAGGYGLAGYVVITYVV